MQPLLSPRRSRARVTPYAAGALALAGVPLAVLLAFLWAPTAGITLQDGSQQVDYVQKIFYVHVPIAFAAYWGFAVGAWNAALYLLRGHDDYDVRSYVGVHVGMVFGTLVLVTGSLWAKAAWGVWWQWADRQLLVFLVLFLFYLAYFMLRFSIEPGAYRARASSVFALIGVVLVPLSFLAIRISETIIHPTVITRDGLQMTSEMAVTFLVACVGFLALASLMMQLESAAKLLAARGRVTAEPAGGGLHAARISVTARPTRATADSTDSSTEVVA